MPKKNVYCGTENHQASFEFYRTDEGVTMLCEDDCGIPQTILVELTIEDIKSLIKDLKTIITE